MIPMRAIMVGPPSSTTRRQAGDAVAGFAQSHGFAPARQQDGIIEATSPDRNRLQIVRSAIRLQGCAECSTGVLFRRFDSRTFRADCCAFLSRSRSSFNSEI
jgi:hypothetical protein